MSDDAARGCQAFDDAELNRVAAVLQSHIFPDLRLILLFSAGQ
jgi:hypothetical protein